MRKRCPTVRAGREADVWALLAGAQSASNWMRSACCSLRKALRSFRWSRLNRLFSFSVWGPLALKAYLSFLRCFLNLFSSAVCFCSNAARCASVHLGVGLGDGLGDGLVGGGVVGGLEVGGGY